MRPKHVAASIWRPTRDVAEGWRSLFRACNGMAAQHRFPPSAAPDSRPSRATIETAGIRAQSGHLRARRVSLDAEAFGDRIEPVRAKTGIVLAGVDALADKSLPSEKRTFSCQKGKLRFTLQKTDRSSPRRRLPGQKPPPHPEERRGRVSKDAPEACAGSARAGASFEAASRRLRTRGARDRWNGR